MEETMKKKQLIILAVLLLTVIAAASFAVADTEVPAFTVKIGDASFTEQDFAGLSLVEVESVSYNHSGKETVAVFTGYRISDILALSGFEGEFLTLTATADDNYRIRVVSGVALEDTTLFALYKDGEAFENYPWFAPCSSQTTGDYLKGVCELGIETEEPPAIPDFILNINGEEIKSKKFGNYKLYTFESLSYNHSGKETLCTYTGIRLTDALAIAGADGEYASITATAPDGYAITVPAGLAAADDTLIAFFKDGEPCQEYPWFAPCSSQTTGDYLKGACTITLNAE